jgi:hypothetical protein
LNKLLLIGIACLALLGAAPARGESNALVDPPVSDRNPAQVNPFVDSLHVTLTAPGAEEILYEINGGDQFDLANAKPYTEPLVLTSNSVVRAVSRLLLLYSDPVEWTYLKDRPPTVLFTAPAAGANLVRGTNVSLSATVSDPDATTPYTTEFSRKAAGESGWTPLGVGNASGSLTVPVNATFPLGANQIRVIGADAKGLTASEVINVTVSLPPNRPPTVSITQPAANASFQLPTTVIVTATASDSDDATANGIQKVEFYATPTGGTPVLIGPADTEAPWSASYANPPAGTYALTAIAYDGGSPQAHTTSAAVNVTVLRANAFPTARISFPENGRTYYHPFIDSVRAVTTDPDGNATVKKVVFRNRNVVESVDNTPVATWAYLKTYPVGTYKLTATATDDKNDSTISDTVTFTVANNQAPTAKAGADVVLLWPANTVALNGSASMDPEGAGLKYEWTGTAGVAFTNANTATAGATISAPGIHTLTLKVTDSGLPPASSSDQMTVTVNSKPAITSLLTASGAAASPFSYQILGSGFPAPTFEVSGNPAWLAFNAATGVLSGTPMATGQIPVSLTAVNASGEDTKTLVISISDSLFKPTIISPLTATAKMSQAFSYNIQATGNPSPTFTASTLPGGLTLAANSGLISGIPTVSGIYTINLTATNPKGANTKALSLTINADPKITQNLPPDTSVREKTKAVFTVKATGFPAVSYQWQYRAGTTGAMRNIGTNSATYTIDSTTTASAGYYQVVVVGFGGAFVVSNMCQLKITPAPIPIRISANPSPLTVVVGDRVQFKAKATGEGTLLYQWFRGTTAVTTPAKAGDTVFVLAAAGANDGGLFRARVTSSAYPDTTKPEGLAYSDTARLVVQLPKLPKPKANPAGGPFFPDTQIVLSNDIAGTTIHYTLDGQDPTQASPAFTGTPVFLDVTRSIKARAYKTGFRASDVMFETYTLTAPDKVVKPSISPPTPTFKVTMKCTLSTLTPGATLYYTLDGSSPLTGTPAVFNGSITLNQTTTIIAVAKKQGMEDSDTLKMTYTLEAISSKVIAPTILPAGGDFTGTLLATLYCATDATIWYTTDGSSPDTSSTRAAYVEGSPIAVTKTTHLRAVATKENFLASDIVSQTYKLIPGPITAYPQPDIIFDSIVTVTLNALPTGSTIRYATEGERPTVDSPVFPADGLTLTATTTIFAIAIMDGVPSTVYSFSYTRKGGQLATPTPLTAGNLTAFKDTMRVGLYSTRGSDIYYTLNGDIPNTSSEKYSTPFRIDSTVTLQAVAVQKGFSNSKILVATFSLVPEMPKASPPGGSYPTSKRVTLSNASKQVKFYYTTDGTDPTPAENLEYRPGDTITIASTCALKAIAVAGNMAGPMLVENYEIFGAKDFTLSPGKIIFLEGGYSLRSPEDQGATVQGRIASSNQLKLDGFDGVQYVINLALDANDALDGMAFPNLVFASPSADKRSMYKLDLSQNIYFISGADTVTLSQPGTYFQGTDISPPVISYLAESFGDLDSTRVAFLVDDNVANLSYDVKRNDNPQSSLARQFLFSGQEVSFKLKHPPGSLKPLYVQLIVTDYQTASSYPTDPGTMLSLSQRMGAIKGPDAWTVGAANSAFDFISIPLALDPPLTVADLRNANPGAALEGVAWHDDIKKYLPLDGSETLRPGQGYWIGARSPVSSLSMASATTLPSGKGTYTVYLKQGWNQIGNPHLEELYWPYSRNLEEAYRGFPIKGLWEYTPSIYDFTEVESMKPWRGYYVYNYLEPATVTLSPRPITGWAMKKPAAGAARISLSLGWGPTRSLRLGADYQSADGLGREDEFSLPRRNQGVFLRALREGSGLVSDWVRLRHDGIQQWKIAMEGSGDSLPPLRILDQELPDGYEAWAVSPSRSMKFRLEAGSTVPASGLAKDTLLVYSGPREMMARFNPLQNLSVAAPSLDLRVSARNGDFNVHMALPTKARIRAVVWTLAGVRQGDFALGPLSEGSYTFTFAGDFHNRPSRLAPGVYFLSLEIQGSGLRTRLTRKIVLPN